LVTLNTQLHLQRLIITVADENENFIDRRQRGPRINWAKFSNVIEYGAASRRQPSFLFMKTIRCI